MRKKYVTLSTPKNFTEEGLSGAFRSSGVVQKCNGILNESHRLFAGSAELWQETTDEPWAQVSPPNLDEWSPVLKFLASRDGSADFSVAFDGRDRGARRAQEDVFDTRFGGAAMQRKAGSSCSELWIVYRGSPGTSVCRTRLTVLSANHVEGGMMSMPVARNKLKVVKRETHAVCGEVTTVFGSYTGVEYRPKPEAPRISSIEKDKIFKQTGRKPLPDAWTEDYGASEPLFWQETKPIGMWRALIQDFQVKSIFDVTAGSGALAEAAMMEGAVYHGLCAAPRDSV